MSNSSQKMSKRQQVRNKQQKRMKQQRLIMILIVVGIALGLGLLLVIPSIIQNLLPVGEIVEITPRVRPLQDGTAMGSLDAPVLIEVWEDFQCHSCVTFSNEVVPDIEENLIAQGKVRYVFYQYPFLDDRASGNESDMAANASLCANEQGQFWSYHDLLFANWKGTNSGTFTEKRLLAFAKTIDLDYDQFQTCLKETRFQDRIDEEMLKGIQLGVTGTPAVLVNGIQLTPGYVPNYSQILEAVEVELNK